MDNPYWHPDYKSHVVDFDEIRDISFRAFSILSASRQFMGMPDEEVQSKVHSLFFERAEGELSAHFLDLAVKMRTFHDILRSSGDESLDILLKKILEEDQLGSVGDAEPLSKRKDLSFREACNKIVHAEDFRPVYDNDSQGRDAPVAWGMEGVLELTGSWAGKDWDVWLVAEEFIEACLEIAFHFDPPS